MTREQVIVCVIEGQWGIWLPGCHEHVTSWRCATYRHRVKFAGLDDVLDVIDIIRQLWRRDYGDELPWSVKVLGGEH